MEAARLDIGLCIQDRQATRLPPHPVPEALRDLRAQHPRPPGAAVDPHPRATVDLRATATDRPPLAANRQELGDRRATAVPPVQCHGRDTDRECRDRDRPVCHDRWVLE